jgi:sterol desaturase/sphingolipid hydroxylase (fatty acid hydroxylase superfamily)
MPEGVASWLETAAQRAGEFLSRINPVYVAGSLALAAIVWLHRRARRGLSPEDFFGFVTPRSVWLHRSSKVDLKFFVVETLLYAGFYAPFALSLAASERGTAALLSAIAPGVDLGGPGGLGLAVAVTLAVVVAMDLGIFLSHWLQHKVPLLWEFHKVHHSAEVLNPLTVYRMHPVDTLLGLSLAGLFGGATTAVFAHAFPPGPAALTLMGGNVFLFLYYLVGYHLRHSHIWIDYGPRWSHVLVSPAQHQIHHSKAERHWDKNLGFVFAWWDWMAGTLYVPREREELTLGLSHDEEKEFDGVWACYVLPLKKAVRKGLGPVLAMPASAWVLLVALVGATLAMRLWPAR